MLVISILAVVDELNLSPASSSSSSSDDPLLEMKKEEVFTLKSIYQDDMQIMEEPSRRKNGKFRIHIEVPGFSPGAAISLDLEVTFKHSYPCKNPQIRKLASINVDDRTADSIVISIKHQAEAIAAHNEEFPEQKEGMTFKLMQSVKEQLDEYAVKNRPPPPLPAVEHKEEKRVLESKPSQCLLADFFLKVNAEKERQLVCEIVLNKSSKARC